MNSYDIPDIPAERYDVCACGVPRFVHPMPSCDGFVLSEAFNPAEMWDRR